MNPEIIIAGAGPAGSVAALQLARAGRRVLLLDRHDFPRDKTCGDGLIADSIGALTALGLAEDVSARSQRTSRLLVVAPSGTQVRFETAFWVLPRLVLDDLLFSKAREAGAEFRRVIVDGPIREGGRVAGVVAHEPKRDATIELRAPLTLLATGASSGILRKFDPSARNEPSGYAVRTYAERPAGELSELIISLDRDLLPGYAWAFPAPGGMINLGIGALRSRRLREDAVNLRQGLDRLLAGQGSLGRILGPLTAAQPYQGAHRTGIPSAGTVLLVRRWFSLGTGYPRGTHGGS